MPLTSALELLDLSEAEADRFFATEPPERVVALVGALDDSQLGTLVAVPHLRSTAVRQVLARLGEFALPGPLTEVKGVVEFCIAVPKGPPERYAVAFDGVGVAVVPPDEHPADVVLAMAALDFVRLVSGGVNAAILVLGDRLEITGDELLALRVGGVFQVPGRSGVAVDPSAVDPEQAAAATKHVKNAHLERVMAGGLRDVVIDQVVQRLPEFLDETKAAGQRLVIGFHIGGRPDGGHDRVLVRVEEGRCEAERLPSPDGGETAGVRAEDRDATLVLGGAQFVKLVLGHLNPVTAVVRGSLKVKGDLHAALALHRVMRIPGSH